MGDVSPPDTSTTSPLFNAHFVHTPVEQYNIHAHICKSCSRLYCHRHNKGLSPHGQFDKQCPYIDCPQFHRGENPTASYPLSYDTVASANVQLFDKDSKLVDTKAPTLESDITLPVLSENL